ncbi:MAG TPA: DNA mismatch repair endonuclease MutL [Anaerolineae bacterium]|nr:DNA mismatch repair endonuclease MutL [Anaerolineae bacterium]
MPIRILSDDLAAKIAAGEVIERPASVVKELVENALDAGARDVRVEVRGGGQRLIRVADDGAGIPYADVPTAFARHGTSKLQSADDLFAIQTLGFRGEALPSIASVARVTMITRNADETNGTRFQVENAQTIHYQPHGAPRGTVVTVEDLFRNVPARLKFLKSPGAETANIAELVHAYALAYPRVRFSLVNDGKLAFQSAGSGKLSDVLVKVLGAETAREMIEVATDDERRTTDDEVLEGKDKSLASVLRPELAPSRVEGSTVVSGYVSPPSIHRGNRRTQYLFVNGRWVEDRALSHAVTEAYHTLLMVGRFPIFVLNLQLPPDAVDVNVHPTKMQVRFREPGEVYRAVQRAVRRALNETLPVPSLTLTPMADYRFPTADPSTWLGTRSRPPTAEASTAALGLIPPANGNQPALDEAITPSSVPMLRVLGQIASTYIICEGPDGMYLVDQHAAHERVLYEKWQNEREPIHAVQELLEPLPLELSPIHVSVFAAEREHLARAGFQIEPFGGQTVLLRAVPSVLKQREPRAALLEILDMTDEGGNPLQAQDEARLVMSICKSAAIKGGQVMSLEEMRALIRDLEKTTSPRTCPHGRPTMIQLNLSLLEREFGRRG